MTNETKANIEKLRAIAPQLNAATDQASVVVERVESFLHDCSIGLPVWVEARCEMVGEEQAEDDMPAPSLEDVTELGYARVGNSYRLAVRVLRMRQYLNNPSEFLVETMEPRAWADCPREMKLETFPHLPDVLARLSEKAQSAVDETSATALTVSELIEAMGE